METMNTAVVFQDTNQFFPGLLSAEDLARLRSSLLKLKQHFSQPFFITGSLAAAFHQRRNGMKLTAQKLNDIDIVVSNLSSLPFSLGKDFLIRHFHPDRGNGKILIMLVDPVQKIRIDIFTPALFSFTQRTEDFVLFDNLFSIISAEDLLVKLLSIICCVLDFKTVNTKYVRQFEKLLAISNRDIAGNLWNECRKDSQPAEFTATVNKCMELISHRPELLQSGEYSKNPDEDCPWCRVSRVFPLSRPSDILRILGYV